MKINVGSKFRIGQEPILALAIPGSGIIEVTERNEQYPFDHVELSKQQLINMRNEIDKELGEGNE